MNERKHSDDLVSNFFRAARQVGRGFYMTQARRMGMHPGPAMHQGQGRLLAVIAEEQPVSQKDLVEKLDIRPSSLSELLKKLEAKGLVERKPDENDKRNVTVSLTEEGAKAAEQAGSGREAFASGLFDSLTEEEQEQLNGLLKKLNESWKEKFDGECGGFGGSHGGDHREGFDPREGFGPGPHMHHRKTMFFYR